MKVEKILLETWKRVGFCLRILLDVVSDITFRLLYFRGRKELPPVTNDILLLSASALASKIRKREITSEELVAACIERIGEVNSLINAVVDKRFEEALEDARKCDRIISTLSKLALEEIAVDQPFLGVPFSTKEGIRVMSLHHSYGVPTRRDIIAVEDATTVRLMRQAGGIPLCVTNVSEVGAWWNTSNYIYGTTCNPYSLSHNPGGSSGGEAALQACAGIPVSFASDTGGSIRTPAAFCGVFGHKPTPNIVSTHGADIQDPKYPVMESMQVLGPICRHAEDLKPILQVLVGDNAHLLQLDADVFLTKCKFFYLTSHVGGNAVSPVEPEVRHAIQRVVDYLEDNFGVTVKPLHIPELKNILSLYTKEMSRLSPNNSLCSDIVNRDGSVWVSLEILRSMTGFGRHTAPVLAQAAMERAGQITSFAGSIFGFKQFLNNQKLTVLKTRINNILGDNGILLSPAHPTTPPYRYQSYTKPFNFLYTAMHNALGLPATVVPLGLSQSGLPLSIQISAAEYNDHLTIALAKELERPFGGWTPPFDNGENLRFY